MNSLLTSANIEKILTPSGSGSNSYHLHVYIIMMTLKKKASEFLLKLMSEDELLRAGRITYEKAPFV